MHFVQEADITVGDKGNLNSGSNLFNVTGGMVVDAPVVISKEGDTFILWFEYLERPHPVGTVYNSNEGGVFLRLPAKGLNPGGPNGIVPIVHNADKQLKIYVHHYLGDEHPRRLMVYRTGIFYR